MSKKEFRIGHLRITDHLILGVAKELEAAGRESFSQCDPRPVAKTGWNEIADALAGSELDAAFVLAPTAMDLYKSGVDLRLVLFTHKTGSVLVKNKRAGIDKIEDFKGKVVLIPYQLSVHNMLFHKMLASVGLKPGTGRDPDADVLLEVMAPVMMPQSIEFDEDGEIGGFIVAEPFGSQAVKGGYCEEFALSKDLWPKHPCCVFVVRADVAKDHPGAVQEVVDALVRAGAYVGENPAEAARIGAGFLNQEEDVIHKVLTEPRDRILTDELRPVVEDLRTIQDYMCDVMGVMKSKIDLDAFVDDSFAVKAGAK